MNAEPRLVSNNERTFLRSALLQGLRIDGRRDVDCRPMNISFIDNGNCEVQLGRTRVVCVVSAKVVEPYPDRANDGMYSFEVALSPMGSGEFSRETWTEDSVEICRVVERALRESNAIDTESLCILAGSRVWSVHVSLAVLDHAGNLLDACAAAALAGLLHFRRPAVTVEASGEVRELSDTEAQVAPLAIHHTPVSVTFGFLEGPAGEVTVVDPSDEEEAVLTGSMSVAVNGHGEVCSVQKAGGCPVAPDVMLRCLVLAGVRSQELISAIEEAVRASLLERGVRAKMSLIAYLEAPSD